ncbi:hypothetical protein [Neomoorella mulderi]|uniref:CAAX amino terminal protease self-immunity n=1 Tax=Moorella mulderi DSM 14980 TaxID=1122241 RepID=A0A151B1R2_9FIRM|nr:hypothetical protein [Moorella mulderi]KYH33851.1 hypothetical protein MOMUL_05670 [Moorella mulderi DSM 14980]
MIFLKTLLVGLMAALVAWAVNYVLLGLGFNNRAILTLLGPLGEEILKTGLALLTGTSLAGVHSVFGLAEAAWELAGAPPAKGPPKLKPALAAVAGHSFFGLLASLAYARSGRADVALATGFLAHLAWNQVILTLHSFLNYKT